MTETLLKDDSKKTVDPKDFTQGPVHSHLLRLTGFMTLGLISIMGASLIETIYVGRLGTDELAALSFAFPLVMIFQGIAMGLAVGASSVVARSMGTGNQVKAKLLITHCLILMALLTLIFSTIAYFNLSALFTLLGAKGEILALTVAYSKLWLFGLPFFTFAMVGSTLMRAMGDAVTPGYLMAIGSLLQIIIAPLFIFGLAGFPKLGLEGAAIGYSVARLISFFIYAYAMMIKDKLLTYQLTGFIASSKEIMHVGLPAVASNLVAPISIGIITRLLASHGSAVVAGFGVAARIESLLLICIFALSMSIAPFLGQNWAAAQFDRVKQVLRISKSLVITWGIIAYVLLFFTAELIVSAINDDPAVIEATVTYLRIVPLAMGFMGMMAIATSSFNALGKPMPPLIITILQTTIIYLPLALLGDYLWGYVGIFVAAAFTMSIMGLVSWAWINKTIDKGIALRMVP